MAILPQAQRSSSEALFQAQRSSSETLLKRSAPQGLQGRCAEHGVFKHLK
jgi:hypothetical protein